MSWLWERRIPYRKLTLIDGDPGTGKSALTMDIAAEKAGLERCDDCREWKEWVVRYKGHGEPDPAPCPNCGFEQSIIRVVHTEEAGRL